MLQILGIIVGCGSLLFLGFLLFEFVVFVFRSQVRWYAHKARLLAHEENRIAEEQKRVMEERHRQKQILVAEAVAAGQRAMVIAEETIENTVPVAKKRVRKPKVQKDRLLDLQ